MNLQNIKRKAYAKYCGTATALTTVGLTQILPMMAEAENTTGTEGLTKFIEDFLKPWLTLIGGVVAMVGGVMFALSWQREDAEGKSKGLMTIMAGFMIVGVAATSGLFITKPKS